jgi:methionine-rich copper-binding protein CopC
MRVGSVFVMSVAIIMGGAQAPAAANTELSTASPADGASELVSPREITMTFTQPVRSRPVSVALTPEGRGAVTLPTPVASGRVIRQQVTRELPPGRYELTWSAESFDGHRTSGATSFTIGPRVGRGDRAPASTSANYDPANPRASEPPRKSPTHNWVTASVLFTLVLLLGGIGWAIIRDGEK